MSLPALTAAAVPVFYTDSAALYLSRLCFLRACSSFYGPGMTFSTPTFTLTRFQNSLSLALRVSIDVTSNIQWNQVMSMALVSVIPLILLFFAAQKYFVEGIATSGLKG